MYPFILSTSVRHMSMKYRSHPKNHQIPFEIVQLEDADGTLHHPHKLSKILETIDTDTHVVRLTSSSPPIVHVFTHAEDKARKVEVKAERKATETKRHIVNKESQMTWHTSGADFDHKVAKIHDDLSKGDVRMDVVFNPKPRVRNPLYPVMMEKVDQVMTRIADVGVEWRERDFKKGSLRLFVQSTVKKEKFKLPTQHEVEEIAHDETERQERQALRKKKREEESAKSELQRQEALAQREKEFAESGVFKS